MAKVQDVIEARSLRLVDDEGTVRISVGGSDGTPLKAGGPAKFEISDGRRVLASIDVKPGRPVEFALNHPTRPGAMVSIAVGLDSEGTEAASIWFDDGEGGTLLLAPEPASLAEAVERILHG